MNRRSILLIFAALIAAIGTSIVFLYARSADSRAEDRFEAVETLTAVKPISPGETVEDAAAAGKFQLEAVPRDQLLGAAMTSTSGLAGQVALTTIYPGEQIIPERFGGAAESSVLPIPKGSMAISVNLTDPARVAGFVTPGSEVSIFMTGTDEASRAPFARLLLDRVQVIGVGSTAPGTTTTTTEDGTSTTEQLPNALLTLAVTKTEAERVFYAVKNGELSFGLLTKDTDLPKSTGVTSRNLFQ